MDILYLDSPIHSMGLLPDAGNVFPRRRFQRKPLVSDPEMHHGTCVTHVPWCMSGSLTRGDGEDVPGIPGACAPAILHIWQEAHDDDMAWTCFPHYCRVIGWFPSQRASDAQRWCFPYKWPELAVEQTLGLAYDLKRCDVNVTSM